jgi:methylated-DNA-[protein]-cysteine S-methyltransferase
MMTWHRHPSPIGELLLTADDDALTGLYTAEHARAAVTPAGSRYAAPFKSICDQLDGFFAGEVRAFEATIRPDGTMFQQRVWDQLMLIPFGRTTTYLDIAKALGTPTAARAIGAANGANPISIIVPCHRVIATGGELTGYAGGVKTKQWLLDHEAKYARTTIFSP